jgi:hypothetical protein
LAEDEDRPKKQRHTAKRIFERLRDEHGFDGGTTIVSDYIRQRKRHCRGNSRHMLEMRIVKDQLEATTPRAPYS